MPPISSHIATAVISFVLFTIIGGAVAAIINYRPRYPSTYTWVGIGIALLHLPLFLITQQFKNFSAYYLLLLAVLGFVVLKRRGYWRAFWTTVLSTKYIYLYVGILIAIIAGLMEIRYERFRYLAFDAITFWQPRAHFIYVEGLLSDAFWNVVNASYPPLLNSVTALFYYLQNKSGELPTLTPYWFIAFLTMQTFSERVDDLVKRAGTGFLILVIFLFAPDLFSSQSSRLYFVELVNGNADKVWQLLYVGAVASGLRRGFRSPFSWDEALLVMIAGLMKEEGSIFAVVYLMVRLMGATFFTRGGVRTVMPKALMVLLPIAIWKILVVTQGLESRTADYSLFMPLDNYLNNMGSIVIHLDYSPAVAVILPWAALLALLPVYSIANDRQAYSVIMGLVLQVFLGLGFVIAAYLFYSGDRINWLLNTTFGRLYGLPILVSLLLYTYYCNHHVQWLLQTRNRSSSSVDGPQPQPY